MFFILLSQLVASILAAEKEVCIKTHALLFMSIPCSLGKVSFAIVKYDSIALGMIRKLLTPFEKEL